MLSTSNVWRMESNYVIFFPLMGLDLDASGGTYIPLTVTPQGYVIFDFKSDSNELVFLIIVW